MSPLPQRARSLPAAAATTAASRGGPAPRRRRPQRDGGGGGVGAGGTAGALGPPPLTAGHGLPDLGDASVPRRAHGGACGAAADRLLPYPAHLWRRLQTFCWSWTWKQLLTRRVTWPTARLYDGLGRRSTPALPTSSTCRPSWWPQTGQLVPRLPSRPEGQLTAGPMPVAHPPRVAPAAAAVVMAVGAALPSRLRLDYSEAAYLWRPQFACSKPASRPFILDVACCVSQTGHGS